MDYYTHAPPDITVIAADEFGQVMPRTSDPLAGWSPDGHRVEAPLTCSRGPEKTWIYGGLRIADGHAVTCCAPSRNSAHWQAFRPGVVGARGDRRPVLSELPADRLHPQRSACAAM